MSSLLPHTPSSKPTNLLPQGVTRRTEWCKQRHATIMKYGESATEQGQVVGPDGQPLDPAAGGNVASLANLSKQQVRVCGCVVGLWAHRMRKEKG